MGLCLNPRTMIMEAADYEPEAGRGGRKTWRFYWKKPTGSEHFDASPHTKPSDGSLATPCAMKYQSCRFGRRIPMERGVARRCTWWS